MKIFATMMGRRASLEKREPLDITGHVLVENAYFKISATAPAINAAARGRAASSKSNLGWWWP
jgi:hypothetical protein